MYCAKCGKKIVVEITAYYYHRGLYYCVDCGPQDLPQSLATGDRMKMDNIVYVVFYSKGRLRAFCGVFSTEKKAQKYIEGVPEDERVWWYSKAVEIDSDFI